MTDAFGWLSPSIVPGSGFAGKIEFDESAPPPDLPSSVPGESLYLYRQQSGASASIVIAGMTLGDAALVSVVLDDTLSDGEAIGLGSLADVPQASCFVLGPCPYWEIFFTSDVDFLESDAMPSPFPDMSVLLPGRLTLTAPDEFRTRLRIDGTVTEIALPEPGVLLLLLGAGIAGQKHRRERTPASEPADSVSRWGRRRPRAESSAARRMGRAGTRTARY